MTERSDIQTNDTATPGKGVRTRIISAIAIVVAIALAFFAFAQTGRIASARDDGEAAQKRYSECNEAIHDLQDASDFLTSQARMFVVTGRPACLEAYLDELRVGKRRGHAVETLKSSFPEDLEAVSELEGALAASDELARDEFSAMRLAAQYYGLEDLPTELTASAAVEGEAEMSRDAKLAKAEDLMLGEEYDQAKADIRARVDASASALLDELNIELDNNNTLMQNLLFQLRISVALLLSVVLVLVLVLLMYVLKPLKNYIKRIEKNEPLEASGSYELHYLARAYNIMYEDNSKRIQQLREFAERDPLTGISNRNGYNNFLATHTRDITLLLIDIDNFKEFNTVYGRDTGNAVMVKLANALGVAFRSTDFPCRLESDKFAVIMTNMNSSLHDAVLNKIELVNSMLADDSDDLPLITLSVGIAFSTEGMTDREIYDAAESALKQAQGAGTNRIVFYGEGNLPEPQQ